MDIKYINANYDKSVNDIDAVVVESQASPMYARGQYRSSPDINEPNIPHYNSDIFANYAAKIYHK